MKECVDCEIVLEDESAATEAGVSTTECYKCGKPLTEQS